MPPLVPRAALARAGGMSPIKREDDVVAAASELSLCDPVRVTWLPRAKAVDASAKRTPAGWDVIRQLVKSRIVTPAKATTCAHVQCFDLTMFLTMNERSPTWTCPICNKIAEFANLRIDPYVRTGPSQTHNSTMLNAPGFACMAYARRLVSDILKAVPSNVVSVTLDADGKWSLPGTGASLLGRRDRPEGASRWRHCITCQTRGLTASHGPTCTSFQTRWMPTASPVPSGQRCINKRRALLRRRTTSACRRPRRRPCASSRTTSSSCYRRTTRTTTWLPTRLGPRGRHHQRPSSRLRTRPGRRGHHLHPSSRPRTKPVQRGRHQHASPRPHTKPGRLQHPASRPRTRPSSRPQTRPSSRRCFKVPALARRTQGKT